jgi:spermidine synthase
VQIYQTEYWDTGEPIKVMKVNNEYSSAIYLERDELVYEYLRYYRLAEHFMPGFRKALMIGGAAFTYPQYFINHYADASIDVVEIDPALTYLAREHFGLRDSERMKIYHEDARTFLNRMHGQYDVIFGDAFKSLLAIPFQLTTLEAVKKQYDILSDSGIMILNIVASLEGSASQFLKAEYKTIKNIFPRVYLFACHAPDDSDLLQSISLVALKSKSTPSFINEDPELQTFLSNRIEIETKDDIPLLTDDHAPVEYYAMKAL